MTIVNFATRQYARGQQRLKVSLGDHKMLMLDNYTVIGSPTHEQSPYEFKVHAIEKAFQFDDIVLWMDASMYAVGDLSVIEKIIIEDGYFMSEAGHWVGQWTNQHARDYFKVTADEMKVPGGLIMFSAGLLGLNKTSPLAMEFFRQWKASAKAGCFRGSHANHRHDMTCGSIIAQRLSMKYQRGGEHMAYIGEGYEKPQPTAVIHLQGLA